MSRVSYVNGRYVPHRAASVSIEDRGFQFADGVYEVTAVRGARLIDEEAHLQRLGYSLSELRIGMPLSLGALRFVQREVMTRNRVVDGIIYVQVTRGAARRDHPFPPGAEPTLIISGRNTRSNAAQAAAGIAVITVPDIRWRRCDIKSVGLLPNVLAKQSAREAGAWEAWFVGTDGNITEGSSTNVWIVSDEGELVTRQADHAILNGITRRTVRQICAELQLRLVERPIALREIERAREAFVTSATSFVMPVVRVNDTPIGHGKPGDIARRLRAEYVRLADRTS